MPSNKKPRSNPLGEGTKGGPAGAKQGGASRGSSRLEPSHQHQQRKQNRPGHKGKK